MSSQSEAIRQVARFTDVSSNPREPCQIRLQGFSRLMREFSILEKGF
jgi:hypothetical protein